jgi:enoyl-CoA hydratase
MGNEMEYENLIVNISESIAHVELNRPDVMNALDRRLVDEIGAVAQKIGRHRSVRSLVISGRGGHFAAGADIAPMAGMPPEGAKAFCFNSVFNMIEDLPFPVIAAISGFALGGGLELALACDIRICSQNAKLGFPEIKLGIFPGAGGTQRLPRLVGEGRAREMIYLGDIIDADAALRYGLCSRVVAGNSVDEALKIGEKLASRPPRALAAAKHVIGSGMNMTLREGIAYEEECWTGMFATEDQKEGMKAFLEKRKPVFTGR